MIGLSDTKTAAAHIHGQILRIPIVRSQIFVGTCIGAADWTTLEWDSVESAAQNTPEIYPKFILLLPAGHYRGQPLIETCSSAMVLFNRQTQA